MSDTVKSFGFLGILKEPITDEEERETINEYLSGLDSHLRLSYDGSVLIADYNRCSHDWDDIYELRVEGDTFDGGQSRDAFVRDAEIANHRVEAASVRAYTCVWYNGSDNPVMELTAKELRQRATKNGTSLEEITAFVRQIACMTKDGDVIDGNEYSADGNDDEVDALHSLIDNARELVPDRPDGYQR